MTDNEILKALECHSETSYNQNACERCPILNHCDCGGKMAQNALDLINRQQAEIEKVKPIHNSFERELECAKQEAIKEFAVRLKAKSTLRLVSGRLYGEVSTATIDTLVQEMVGDE